METDPPDNPPQVSLVVDCIARLQDLFNACQRVGMPEDEQLTLLLQIERSLSSLVSECLAYSGTGNVRKIKLPNSSGGGTLQ